MNCCNDFGQCTQDPDCPARAAPANKPAQPTVQELAELAYEQFHRLRVRPDWADLLPVHQHRWIALIQKIITRIQASR